MTMAKSMTMAVRKKHDRDMTQGACWKHILFFALPLLLGNVFQQFYTTVDNVIVGRFLGKAALAAVGSSAPIIFSMIGFFMGLSAGAGVVISQYYGGKQFDKVSRTVQTTMVMTFVLCVVISFVGYFLAPFLLRVMHTPDDVMENALIYFRIYFSGATGLLIYNMGSGILRAVGDSVRPLFFLIFTALLNTVLDLVFVLAFKWGIAGVAWATVISQAVSATLILIVLTVSKESYRLIWKKLSVDWYILGRVVKIGFPAAIQQFITAISNVFVQSYINYFGSAVMAGWSAYRNIDMFMLLPMMSVSLSATTFTGQNIGAKKIDRVRLGVRTALCLSYAVTILVLIPILIFAPRLIMLFNKEADVVEMGVLILRLLSPFYLACVINQVFAGVLRGAGDAKAPMFIMLFSFVFFRQTYLFIASHITENIQDAFKPILLGYPVGWIVCSVVMLVYYTSGRWKKFGNSNS